MMIASDLLSVSQKVIVCVHEKLLALRISFICVEI